MVKGWEVYENLAIGIVNPGSCIKLTGPPEVLERIAKILIKIENMTEEEREKYLSQMETNLQ